MNYDSYFDRDHHTAYQWDVGPMSIRRLVRNEVKGSSLLEVGPGLNRIFSDSDTMDLQGSPTYRRSISDDSRDLAERYDTIIMVHVLEHVVQDRYAIEQCYRMLRPGGVLVVVSPGHNTGVCTDLETQRNGHIRLVNLAYAMSLQLDDFRLKKYRSVHVAHNIVWNKLKYVLKACYYPAKILDHKEMYDRASYRRIAPKIMRWLDSLDRKITRARNGNVLFVLEKRALS